MNTINKILEAVTPEVYENFKRAIEVKKWPDGRALSQDQLEICLQAVIAYEVQNLPPEQRTGYVPPKKTACADDHASEPSEDSPLKWRN